jgi:hypothetical protein
VSEEFTMQDMTELCSKFAQLRDQKSDLEDQASEIGKQIAEIQQQIIEKFVEYGIPRFEGPFGTLSVVSGATYKQPETTEEKLKLFDYLKAQGLYEEMVKVDSRTLSSWATKEVEAKERDGILGFIPPGLTQPHEFMKLSLRKKK